MQWSLSWTRWGAWLGMVLLIVAAAPWPSGLTAGQPAAQTQPAEKKGDTAEERANAALNAPSTEKPTEKTASLTAKSDGSLIDLFHKGGPLMYPIVLLSLIALGFTIERMIALRRSNILPLELEQQLNLLIDSSGPFDYRKAYQLCKHYPSSTATVVRAMVDKTGRSTSEIEETLQSTCDREGSRLYENIRPIALTFAVAPLFGLLGTVLGMIQLFHAAASAPEGVKSATLADGIYTKLITTFAGLTVAIPAVISSQLLEGRIRKLFNDVGDLTHRLVRPLEYYEGKGRPSPQQLAGGSEPIPAAPPVRSVPVAPLAKPAKA